MANVCPQCGWRAPHQAYWACDECRTPFDTFEHQGVCPSCHHEHEVTLCPRCRVWSRHEDWYRVDELSWWERLWNKEKKKKREE
jgi:predicted amidophosphoribosyltransferase